MAWEQTNRLVQRTIKMRNTRVARIVTLRFTDHGPALSFSGDMKNTANNRSKIFAVCMLALTVSISVAGQQPAASPQPSSAPSQTSSNGDVDSMGNYSVISSIEFGYRGLSVDGDHNKYRRD